MGAPNFTGIIVAGLLLGVVITLVMIAIGMFIFS